MKRMLIIVCATLIILSCIDNGEAARGGRGRSKGKGKNILPFGSIAEYSLVSAEPSNPLAARVEKGSHFDQHYRLGYKILLICVAWGDPMPTLKWYKNGSEFPSKSNMHLYEKRLGANRLWSKIEIDPATMGDAGIYSCTANNEHGLMAKNFKVECDNC